MQQPTVHRPRHTIRAAFLLATVVAVVGLGANAVAAPRKSMRVVERAQNAVLGRTVLTNEAGRTLYSLSVETNGRFVCTGSCLSVWRPLVVAAGVKPTGPVKLGLVKRPDGRMQVAFKGKPLYRFGGDTKAGEANGEGIEDVGTWHAAAKSAAAAEPPSYPGSY
jgi:predicted lipoprotein with Yx(FWY)xxD motif